MTHDLWLWITNYFSSVSQLVSSWPVWEYFRLAPAKVPNSGSIFNFAEYLAALALLLVVLTASDFRFRYRLSLIKPNLRVQGLWVGLGVGAAILAVDVWFQNSLPVPRFAENPNNLKAALATIFLVFVFRVIRVAVLRPPRFSSSNAKQFFETNYHFIHEGSTERLQVIAEELRLSLEKIVGSAAKGRKDRGLSERRKANQHEYAANFLLLIGDRRFCKVVVDKVPTFALICFTEAQKYTHYGLPIFQFARNIGQEFITNVNSAFYQEESGYYSGLIGYARPVTHTVFGSYEFIERCAADGGSPLDTDYLEFSKFSARQIRGFTRASLTFLETYLKEHRDAEGSHSYALTRMFHSFETALSGTYRLNGAELSSEAMEYEHLRATVHFIKEATSLVEKYASPPAILRPPTDIARDDIYDELARLVYEVIFAASAVTTPMWTAWSIQHNAVWSDIFGLNRNEASRLLGFKVRRLMYRDIKEMDNFPNFRGARILGYCLNVLGLTLVDRHRGFQREFYPLQAVAIGWVKANYRRLLTDHPNVAAACLHGSVSYDAQKHQLVKTYRNDTRKEPNREYLSLD